jgi:hypothetical protein
MLAFCDFLLRVAKHMWNPCWHLAAETADGSCFFLILATAAVLHLPSLSYIVKYEWHWQKTADRFHKGSQLRLVTFN